MPQGHIGIENYEFGADPNSRVWQFQLGGGGGDVYLYQIWGHVTGGPQPFANAVANGTNYVRQSLCGLYLAGEQFQQAPRGKVILDPGLGGQAGGVGSFDNSIAFWNIKQSAYECPVIPVNIQWRVPKLIPNGMMWISIVSMTEVTFGGAMFTDTNVQQCVDTEIHLTFDWETTPPPTSGGGGSGTAQIIVEELPGLSLLTTSLSVRQNLP
jgi:hypothetical protein